ncbi:hypothetical protein UJ101_01247 [Flavobacteriaceae bacterium UJ101]|nr:hypothetical protein UJ101_01247 [Flavobacteriaceae bacterium UJ101]
MKLKQVMMICLLGFMTIVYSQEKPKFQVGLSGSYVSAGEYMSSYDMLGGVDAKYFLKQGEKLHPFVNAGILMDVSGSSETSLFGANLGVGAQYDLIQIKNKPLYLELGIGGIYTNEQFSTQLIDRTVDTTVSEVDFMGNLGVGYRWSKHINTQLNLTQIGSKATGIGFGISYSFN